MPLARKIHHLPLLIALMALGLTLVTACSAAERRPVRGAVVARSAQLAAKAAATELAAHFSQAADLYLQAAVAAAEEALLAGKKKNFPGAGGLWAETEFLLEKGCALHERNLNRRSSLTHFKRLAKLSRTRPLLQARITWRRAQALRAAGEDKAATKELSRLGFVTDWRILGPFDNERGQGFAKAYPPESGIDLQAEYPGKKRKLRWRANPVSPPDGLIDLAGMLRPNHEAVAYLLTYVKLKAHADVPAALRLGSGDGVRVWLNGRMVFERDAHRDPGFDQDVVGVHLRPGWNALLVKVAQSTGPWGLRLRITDPAGAALNGISLSSDQKRKHVAATKAAPPPVARGAADHFELRIRKNPKDAAALLRLGFLTSRAAAFDAAGGTRPDRDLLCRATRARPADARIWYQLSFASAVGGRLSAETDENPRRRALEKSVSLSPSVAAEVELADYFLRRYENFKKAGRHLARARTRNPDSMAVKLLEVALSAERGDGSAALVAAARLVRFSPNDARTRRLRARLLNAADNPARAAEDYAAALKHDSSDQMLEEARESFEKSGQAYRSLELLRQLLTRHPYRIRLYRQRARLLAGRGDYGAAVAECRRALKVAPEDHLLLAQLAEDLDWLGKKAEARALRKQALRIRPNFVELERKVEYLEGRKAYDRRYRENSRELLAAARKLSGKPGDSAAYALYKVIDRVYQDGTSSRTVHLMVRVLSAAGARRFATQRVLYYAGEQRAVVRTARVYRSGGGSEKARVHPQRTYTRAEREIGLRLVQFPALTVGDVVELEYRIDELQQGFFGKYFGNTFYFRQEVPVLRAKYVLITPADMKIHVNPVRCKPRPVLTRDRQTGARVRTWTALNQKKIAREPMMASLREVSPAIQVSTYRDWASFGKWYWGLIRKQHQAGPLVRKKARQLGASAKTELDKIKAIYNYVITDVRYVAWEFGVHGFQPYRAEQILARGFGDCKDKATLICSMLAEQGIKAHPVLIRAEPLRQKQDLSLPLISHFNHCIVYVPGSRDRPELWLDGTAAFTSFDALPDNDRNAKVAVITPEGALVRAISKSAPSHNSTSDHFTLTLMADGSARGEVRATAGGNRSVVMRRAFRNRLHRARILDRLHGRSSAGAAASAVSFSDLRDLNVPVSYKYSLRLPAMVRERDGLLELELPDNPLRGVLGSRGGDKLFPVRFSTYCPGAMRTHDLVLPAAWQSSTRHEISLPPGWKPVELPRDVKLQTEFGRLTISCRFAAGKLIIEKQLALAVTRVPAAKYRAFRKFCLAVDRLEAQRVYLVKSVPPPKRPDAGKRNGGRRK
jgi:tetratricopeptide (TPR) repeat protein